MVSFRVQDPSKYTQDELHLMKTQDLRYVLNKAQAEDRVSTPTLSLSHVIATWHSLDGVVGFRTRIVENL